MKELLRSTTAYRTISEDARRGELAHAVLVTFPDDKYLRTLLRECAKAFFLAADGSREEKLLEEEHFSDCLFLPEPGGKLTAELGAYIIDESLLRPVEGEKKLFVLDAFHTVTPLVQNKLLKILEEPPEGVFFLLGTANEYAVLPTVRSRVKKFVTSPFSEEDVAAALRRSFPTSQGIEEAARASGGVYSVAESLLLCGGEDFRRAERFLAGEDVEVLCRSLGDRGQARPFFAAVRLVLRDVMLTASGRGPFASRRSEGVRKLAKYYHAGAAMRGIEFVDEAERQVGFNANLSQSALALFIRLDKERKKWQRLQS